MQCSAIVQSNAIQRNATHLLTSPHYSILGTIEIIQNAINIKIYCKNKGYLQACSLNKIIGFKISSKIVDWFLLQFL